MHEMTHYSAVCVILFADRIAAGTTTSRRTGWRRTYTRKSATRGALSRTPTTSRRSGAARRCRWAKRCGRCSAVTSVCSANWTWPWRRWSCRATRCPKRTPTTRSAPPTSCSPPTRASTVDRATRSAGAPTWPPHCRPRARRAPHPPRKPIAARGASGRSSGCSPRRDGRWLDSTKSASRAVSTYPVFFATSGGVLFVSLSLISIATGSRVFCLLILLQSWIFKIV